MVLVNHSYTEIPDTVLSRSPRSIPQYLMIYASCNLALHDADNSSRTYRLIYSRDCSRHA